LVVDHRSGANLISQLLVEILVSPAGAAVRSVEVDEAQTVDEPIRQHLT
jgi:hypothetical protein